MVYNARNPYPVPRVEGGGDVPREVLLQLITELLRDCTDVDLLELIYKLLLQNTEQLHDGLKLDRVQI